MRNFLVHISGTAALVLLLNSGGFAQFSLGVQGGLAKANVVDANIIGGGGVNLRMFTCNHLAFGIAGKMFADKGESNVAGQTLKLSETLIPVTGTVDYFLLTGLVRPYVGGDAGVYFSKYDAKLDGRSIVNSSAHGNFGVAPRAGVLFALGSFGIQIEGIYNFVFGNTKRGSYNSSSPGMDLKSTSEYGGVNVGIVFGLDKKKL